MAVPEVLLSECINLLKASEAYKNFLNLMHNEPAIAATDLTSSTSSKIYGRNSRYRNGIYFAYQGGVVVYVGMVSDRPKTSLYHRFKGHGNSAHKFPYEFVRFLPLPSLSKFQLKSLESIFIITLKPQENKTT